MNELLTKVFDAHGGLERWRSYNKVEATIVSGGGFFALKGVLQDANPRRVTVWLHEERTSVTPYGRKLSSNAKAKGVARYVHKAWGRPGCSWAPVFGGLPFSLRRLYHALKGYLHRARVLSRVECIECRGVGLSFRLSERPLLHRNAMPMARSGMGHSQTETKSRT